jgi:NADH-quinone oxidoreductase subunit J
MTLLFLILSGLFIGSALGVVFFRSAISNALCLIVSLVTVAGFFAMLDAHFLMAVQIIVYAGAIMVLVIFVMMLLNTKTEEVDFKKHPMLLGGAVVGALAMVAVCTKVFAGFKSPASEIAPIVGSVEAIGQLLYGKYLFLFEAASILIMAAIVVAVMLAKRRYR